MLNRRESSKSLVLWTAQGPDGSQSQRRGDTLVIQAGVLVSHNVAQPAGAFALPPLHWLLQDTELVLSLQADLFVPLRLYGLRAALLMIQLLGWSKAFSTTLPAMLNLYERRDKRDMRKNMSKL